MGAKVFHILPVSVDNALLKDSNKWSKAIAEEHEKIMGARQA
jgi:hypothetical protein